MTFRHDALLCSINARLGALLPANAEVGADFEPLGWDWLFELGPLMVAEAEELPDAPALDN